MASRLAAEIETARLALRPSSAGDLADLHRLWGSAGVRRFLFDGRDVTREEADEYLSASIGSFASHGYGLWCVREREASALLGFAGFLDDPSGPPQLMYGIDSTGWGRGFATEAARAVLRHGFEALALPRVVADVDEPNVASVRVLEKLGMRRTNRRLVQGRPILDFELLAPVS